MGRWGDGEMGQIFIKGNVSIQPSAFSYQHSAISIQLSAFSYQHSAISIQLSAFSYQ
ncbi:MAG: hypothetical protein F6K44_29980, partial [Moorea sp. SIO3E2]|nr:hypothetical protein [Moorena sp. SIO3E2]